MHSEQGKSGGFLSRVMHMVRGEPSASSAAAGNDPDSQSHREILREVVERKRRNDTIRQQEFAQLRQLRQRSALAGQAGQLAVTRVAANFLHSLPAQDARSVQTLQKIDEIEAQMSGQWWKSATDKAPSDAGVLRSRKPFGADLSHLPVLGEEHVVGLDTLPPLELDAPTHTVSMPSPSLAPALAPVSNPPQRQPTQEKPVISRLFKPHPDLEEAAILFAHGDLHGARTRLLEQLVQCLNSAAVDEEKVAMLWHAILDWCRAAGDEETFEPLAIDYAEHFGRSAPLWSSIPARLGIAALYGQEVTKLNKRQVQWSCPAMFTVGSVTALRSAHKDAPQPWSMSWVRLASMDEAALAPLIKLFNEWASSTGQFVLSDAGKLFSLLEQHSPVGEFSHHADWWVLRMAVLRLLHRMDEYEQVALDYCITYEVSPPSWVDPLCQCVVQESGEADVSLLQETSLLSTQSIAGKAGTSQLTVDSLPGLQGVMEGDIQDVLDALSALAQSGKVLEIPCENLIRLDFVAAGGILNWAADMQNQGYELRFTQVHQLVAAFFHVIGIQEHASIQATLA